MGVNDRARDRKDDKRRAANEERTLRNHTTNDTTVADWTNATSDLLVRFIATVAATGGATRFGYTRDGGAYAVGIYGDGTPYTLYITPGEDLDEWLRNAIEDYEAAGKGLAH